MYTAKPHIASFELRNYSYLKSLVETYSIPCDWHTTSGVHAYFSASLFAQARRVVEHLGETHPDLAANVAVVTREEDEDDRPGHHRHGGAPAYLPEAEQRELTLAALRIPDADGAVVQWHAASLWPYRLVAFVLERLLAAGRFNLQTNTPVTGLHKVEGPPPGLTTASPTSPTAGAASSAGTWTVHTPRGDVAARSVLLATNAYTSHLLPQFSDLIVPTRGQIAALLPPGKDNSSDGGDGGGGSNAPRPPLDIGHTFYLVGDDAAANPVSRDDYLVQRPPPPTAGAELVLGGGRQLAKDLAVGVWDDATLDEPVAWWLRGTLPACMDLRQRDARQVLARRHDGQQQQGTAGEDKGETGKGAEVGVGGTEGRRPDLVPTHEWTGIMGFSRDAHPWVGAVPASLGGDADDDADREEQEEAAVVPLPPPPRTALRPGLYVAAGYTGHGMPNAALCGRAAALLMTGAVLASGGEADGIDEMPDLVDLPPEYLVSEERVRRARMRVSVLEAEETGSLLFDLGAVGGGGLLG